MVQIRTEPPMHAYNFLINNSADWHDIEHIQKILPYFKIISSFA